MLKRHSHYFIVALILSSAFAFIIPRSIFITAMSEILLFSTFVFTILVGFYIGSSLSNYLRLQRLVAEETANLVALYDICKIINIKISEELKEAIDTYLINSFDFELIDSTTNTEKEFNKLFFITNKIKNKETPIFCLLLSTRYNLLNIRQEFDMCSRKIISLFEWVILIILATLNLIFIYSMGDPTLISYFITIVFGFTIIFILMLLHLLDNNTLSEEKMSFLIYQTVFQKLDKLQYFPETIIKSKRVNIPKEKYRLGQYINIKKDYQKKIIIIDK